MAGRKQHFIQQLLQKGFSYDAPAKSCHVWVYHRKGKVFPSATSGYAAERDFYGDPRASGLDAEVTALENERFDHFLQGLRDGASRKVNATESTAFAIHVFSRSKNLRSMFTAGIEPLMARCRTLLEREGVLEALVISAFRRDPVQLLASMGHHGVPPLGARAILDVITPILPELVKEAMDKQEVQINSFLESFYKKVPGVIADAHRTTLRQHLWNFSGSRVDQLSELEWRIVCVSESLVLGDSVVFAELADGTFKPATEPGDDLVRVWLPISSHRVLVGSALGANLESRQINFFRFS